MSSTAPIIRGAFLFIPLPMYMEEKLKIKIRKNLPETNSSSSHSLVIETRHSAEQILPGHPLWDIPIDESGYMHIDGLANFGRGYAAYNGILAKVQYLCGIYCCRCRTERETHPYLSSLTELLCKKTGLKGVIYDWIKDFYAGLFQSAKDLEKDPPEDGDLLKFASYYGAEAGWPEIDHQGSEIFPDILDNIEDFLFNPETKLWTGSDECDAPYPEFYGKVKPYAYLRVYIPDPIGRLDLPIYEWPCRQNSGARLGEWASPVKFIVFEDGVPKPLTQEYDLQVAWDVYEERVKRNCHYFFDYSMYDFKGGRKILWCHPTFYDVITDMSEKAGKRWADKEDVEKAILEYPDLVTLVKCSFYIPSLNLEYEVQSEN